MADIFRAPLYSKHHRRPDPPSQWAPPNLLTTTLFVAAAALPFNTASSFTQVQHPSHAKSVNADTSRGTPKTLTADAVAPFFDASAFASQHPRGTRTSNPDTSHGSPVTLFPVAAVQAPFSTLLPTQVDGKRREVRSDVTPNLALLLPPDQIATAVPEMLAIYRKPVTPTNTSFRASVILDIVVAAPPFFNVAHIPPLRTRWLPGDTSKGIPKALTVDAVAPLFNAPHFAPQAKSKRGYLNADASRGINIPLSQFVQPPPFAQTDWPPPLRRPPGRDAVWGYAPNAGLFPPIPSADTGAVIYIPMRMWASSTSLGVVPSTDQTNLKTWLPPISVPVVDNGGRMNVQWYRFFNYFANVKSGGPEAPTITDIAATVTNAQDQATEAAETATAVQQQVVNNAEALSSAREVLIDNDVPGARQIPTVKKTWMD